MGAQTRTWTAQQKWDAVAEYERRLGTYGAAQEYLKQSKIAQSTIWQWCVRQRATIEAEVGHTLPVAAGVTRRVPDTNGNQPTQRAINRAINAEIRHVRRARAAGAQPQKRVTSDYDLFRDRIVEDIDWCERQLERLHSMLKLVETME